MKSIKYKIFFRVVSVLILISGVFLVNFNAKAATPSVTIGAFTIRPTSIPYSSSSTLNYNFTLSTPSTTATKEYCSSSINFANGDINWVILENRSAQPLASGTISADDFLGSLNVSKTGTFSFGPQGSQSVASFQLSISCYGSLTYGQITRSAVETVNVTGQAPGTVSLIFGSDKTGQNVQPNSSVPVTFQLDVTSDQSYLLQKCTGSSLSSKLTYAIFQFDAAHPTDRSNQIFASNISFSSFPAGSWSTIKNSIPLNVSIPGTDVGFIAQARCNTSTILTESSQLTIRAGGSVAKYSCNSSRVCVADASGTYTTSNCNNQCVTAPSTSGTTQNYSFDIPNPLKGGVTDFTSLVKVIAQWIFNLAIPIAVAMIVYAGILFLTSQGDTSKITKAKEILKYAVIGLAIILIGSGFITLIQSVLELGGTTPPPAGPGGPLPPGPVGPLYGCTDRGYCVQVQDPNNIPGSYTEVSGNASCNNACNVNGPTGDVGSLCKNDRDCQTSLRCKDTVCTRANGNFGNEPCLSSRNCGFGNTVCDRTQVIINDGRRLGTCTTP